jgi:hypothetical protein
MEYQILDNHSGPEGAAEGQGNRRLLTNILGCNEAPAAELAGLHHERRETENLPLEPGTALCGSRACSALVRSKRPDPVIQELWGMLIVNFAARQLMNSVSWNGNPDTGRSSLKQTVDVIRR